ncbi:hypothetical protein JNUCC1_00824 [Lentibacillus sp. JNUCC-1]|nr:acyltransferase family protein [Lentibacillus sp. JNUCC-1]MUV37018.1 hypothetical protein [Lentibacillus sp. JNUCC-1]
MIQLVRVRKYFIVLFLLSVPLNYFWLTNTGSQLQGAVGVITGHHSFILNWLSYFLLGAVLAYYYEEIMLRLHRYRVVLGMLFVWMVVGIYVEITPGELFGSMRPANLIYIPIFFLFLLSVYERIARGKYITEFIHMIGNYSMGIYLVHPLIILLLEGQLPSYMWNSVLILPIFGLTIAGSIAINKLILLLPISQYIVPVGKRRPRSVRVGVVEGDTVKGGVHAQGSTS